MATCDKTENTVMSQPSTPNPKFGLGRGSMMHYLTSTPGNEPKARFKQPEQHQYFNMTPYVSKLPTFSGDESSQKGDVQYNEWRFEVTCLLNDTDISESMLLQAIRRSIRGSARKMTIPLGEKATVHDILLKLDAMFGDV